MTMSTTVVINAIEMALSGELSLDDVNALVSTLKIADDKNIKMALHDVQHYVTDVDIRECDAEYADEMSNNLRIWKDKLLNYNQ